MFENILAHNDVKEYLTNILNKNEYSHSYLFVGKSGIGKKKLALEFTKQILKVDNLNASSDFKIITKKEDKKYIVIEQIRKELVDDVYLTPIGSEYKVYIIDEAEFLNKAAQNTLLKTLEEPPKYVIIILISSTESNFLPTIMSRVTKVNFNKLDNVSIQQYITNQYNIAISDNIINFVDGSIGMLDNLIKEQKLSKLESIEELYNIILKCDIIKAFNFLENIDFNELYILDYLEYLFYKNKHYNLIDFIEKSKVKLRYNGNYDIVISNMILKIIKELR